MKILIVEDDVVKAARIVSCVTSVGGVSAVDVIVANDLVSARDALRTHYFELLILDIRLPNIAGEDVEDGGVSLIKELRNSTTLLKPFHIIGVTAYDEAIQGAGAFFEEEVWQIIKYDVSSDRWKVQLANKISYLVRSKQEIQEPSNRPYLYDLGIITALHDPELTAVLRVGSSWSTVSGGNDATVYHLGLFENGEKRLKVVAAAAPQMGMPAAAVLSAKMIAQFRPKYLAMVGIAAGLPGDGRGFGDILVAERCWNYEAGKKVVKDGVATFVPEPMQIPLNTALREKFLNVKFEKKYLNEIQEAWTGEEIDTKLDMFVGPIATGSAVVADANFRDGLKDQQQRKLIGIEMESYAVYYAAENCPKPQPTVFSAKSICDFADSNKDAKHQRYASYTSASFLHRFAIDELESVTV